MAITEQQLKGTIKTGGANLYVLYGPENYLTEQYARMIVKYTVEEGFDAFNLQKFDGQSVTVEQLEDAVEALPMMTDRKCVLVRDMDLNGDNGDRMLRLIEQVPDSCVLVFWQMTVQPNQKRNAWKHFLEQAKQVGVVMKFDHRTVPDAAKMLVSGAKRRGCALDFADAKYLVEQVGNDLHLLICELDKLCALAVDGTITRKRIDTACAKNLEARAFDLSKAILRRRPDECYDLLHQLAVQRAEPVVVLGALSSAYGDLYRAKVAAAGGVPAGTLATEFKSYKGKEWKLNNATRDAARLSVPLLRDSLEMLADADRALKSRSGDQWVYLEQIVAGLICRAREELG